MDLEERLSSSLSDIYTIEGEIGRGAMATVYLALDRKHGRKVAIKVLNPELSEAVGKTRFLQEIQTSARLTHPNILPLHDSGETDGLLYFVMPYVEGESLRARLDREKQLPVDDAIRTTLEVARALVHAHKAGLVHRDVKPANILLESGQAVLADFGLAQAMAADLEDGEVRLTRAGVSVGTPAYMSPEQAMGEQRLDGRSDQYALACILFEMLAGEPAFGGPNPRAILAKKVSSPPPPITLLRPSVQPGIGEVLRKALHRSPVDRFGTMEEFVSALEAAATTPSGTHSLETPTWESPRPRLGPEPPRTGPPRDESGFLEKALKGMVFEVLLVYAVFSAGILGLLDFLIDRLGLSQRSFTAGVGILLTCFPLVLMTAMVQAGILLRVEKEEGAGRRALRAGVTWRNAGLIGTGVVVAWVLSLILYPSPPAPPPPAPLNLNRVAILFFDAPESDNRLQALSTGLSSSLINELTRVDRLEVISSNGARRFRESDLPPQEIAGELEAGTLVTGSLQLLADTLAVFFELVDGRNGVVLHADNIRRPFSETLELRDVLTEQVAGALRIHIGREIRLETLRSDSDNLQAWLLVQEAVNLREQARELRNQGLPLSAASASRTTVKADSILAAAQSLEPEWAPALLLRGWLRSDELNVSVERDHGELVRLAEEGIGFANQVLEKRPDDPLALELRGVLISQTTAATQLPQEAAERMALAAVDLRRALEGNPHLAQAWNALSRLQWLNGEFEEAVSSAERALEQDQFLEDAEEAMHRLAFSHLQLGHAAQMEEWCARGLRSGLADWRFVECYLAHMAYVPSRAVADPDSALRLYLRLKELTPAETGRFREGDRLVWLSAVHAKAGDQARALEVLGEALEERNRIPGHATAALYDEAYIRLLLGERERALDLLEQYAKGAPQFRDYLARDIIFSPLRQDPRFRKLTSE